jgi:hypothetical protein
MIMVLTERHSRHTFGKLAMYLLMTMTLSRDIQPKDIIMLWVEHPVSIGNL